MPPKRRSTGPAAATRNSQPRLSFAKGQSTKVTKPSTATADVKKSLAAKKVHEIEAAVEITTPTTAEVSVKEQVKSELKDPVTQSHTTEDVLGGRAKSETTGAVEGPTKTGWVSDEETRARKTPQKRINEYWAEKEAARKAPRVHQQDLSLGEKILREWDMSNEYGPCIGIARMKRWKRANVLGLSPPIEVLAVLLQSMDGADPAKMQRAHVDELLSSRYVEP